MPREERVCDWIVANLELANDFGLQGIVPIHIGGNDITFQSIGYRVVYSYDPETKTLMRVDKISESVAQDESRRG